MIVKASWAGTVAFTVTAVAAAISPDTFEVVALAVALILFAAGTVVFLVAFVHAVGRSRAKSTSGSAACTSSPGQRRATCRSISLALSESRSSSRSPLRRRGRSRVWRFGMLVPLYGLGLCGLWGAYHGAFPPRAVSGFEPDG